MKLAAAEFSYNQGKQASTGQSPFYLNHGEEANVPATLIGRRRIEAEVKRVQEILSDLQEDLEAAKSHLRKAQLRQKQHADKGRREETFQVGEEVLLSTVDLQLGGNKSKKLGSKFIGPFPIMNKIGQVAYRIQLPAH